MRALFLAFTLVSFVTGKGDEPATAASTNRYQNMEHRYRITFPEGWTLAKPNQTFTQVKALAPRGRAAMSVARRDSLWREDSASARYSDAWTALDGISITTFTNNFERNVSTQSPSISTVEKTTIGTQNAIKVDYVLKDSAKTASIHIRSFFILRAGHWYSISCATPESQPDLFLDAMLKAVETFEFYDANDDG